MPWRWPPASPSNGWTLAAWCEWRQDFRSFRVDRIEHIRPLSERFADEPGKTLADLLRRECEPD